MSKNKAKKPIASSNKKQKSKPVAKKPAHTAAKKHKHVVPAKTHKPKHTSKAKHHHKHHSGASNKSLIAKVVTYFKSLWK